MANLVGRHQWFLSFAFEVPPKSISIQSILYLKGLKKGTLAENTRHQAEAAFYGADGLHILFRSGRSDDVSG